MAQYLVKKEAPQMRGFRAYGAAMVALGFIMHCSRARRVRVKSGLITTGSIAYCENVFGAKSALPKSRSCVLTRDDPVAGCS